MPASGEDHGEAVLLAGGDHLVVPAGSAGLYDRGDARAGCQVDRISEGEESVRGEDRAGCPAARLLDCDPDGIDATGLTRPDSDGGSTSDQDDSIALDVAADREGEEKILEK